jgi:hypothetical protein
MHMMIKKCFFLCTSAKKEAISFDRKKKRIHTSVSGISFCFLSLPIDQKKKEKRNNHNFLCFFSLDFFFFIRPINDFLRLSSMLKPIIFFSSLLDDKEEEEKKYK